MLVIDANLFDHHKLLHYNYHVTGCEDVAEIPILPEEIIDKILVYEHYLLMKDHFLKFKHVLKDIEEDVKIILIDRDWTKRYYCEIDDVFHLNFVWKRSWIQKTLEGAALYIGRERIVCSKRVPGRWADSFVHPYCRTQFNNWTLHHDLTRQEAKLIKHQYFHR